MITPQLRKLGALFGVLLLSAPAVWAQDDAPVAPDSGDTAWMLTSVVLVLFMTLPGLALFYGGLVRAKNLLSVLMHCFAIACLASILWVAGLYTLAFSEGGKWIGDTAHLFLRGISADDLRGGTTMPETVFIMFQMTFAIITPGLIVGAFVERMKFGAVLLFSGLWLLIVYAPVAHWVWGGGWMADKSILANSTLDLAGGIVVHTTAGISALVLAKMLGPRAGFPKKLHVPHNPGMVMIGASMLWVGWFGFNAGSELLSDHLSASAFCATHFAAAAGAVAWACYEWIALGKPSVLGAASGAVAGLVCITPAAGFVNPMPALLMGAVAGVACSIACGWKSRFGYDDSLDAFGIHGVGGTLGALLTGLFATRACWDIAGGKPLGLLEGGSVLTGQIAAVVVTWIFSLAVTFVLLKIVEATIGLRVSPEAEQRGLDLSEHDEEGYILF